MPCFISSHIFVLFFLIFVIFCCDNEIDARQREVIPVPGLFYSAEDFTVRNFKEASTEKSKIIIVDKKNPDKHKTRKRRKRIFKKIAKKMKDGTPSDHIFELEEIKKKITPKNNFVNTMDARSADSNLSGSSEKKKQRKPVDIIVHIKMNE